MIREAERSPVRNLSRPLEPRRSVMNSESNNDTVNDAAPLVTAEGEALPSDPRRLRYTEIATPSAGDHVEIAAHVRWARVPLPIDLNHINLWFIEDAEGCIAVDTGMAAPMCTQAWEQFDRSLLQRKPLKGLFVTHVHPDHMGLAQWVQERYGVPVWMSNQSLNLARAVYVDRLPSSEMVEAFLRTHGVIDVETLKPMFKPERFSRMTSGLPQVERFIEDGDTLKCSTTSWSVLRTDGHAEGHLCLFEPGGNLLISGDQVLPTISSNISIMLQHGDTNPLRSYLLSLERLRQLPSDTLVLPSHGKPFIGLQQRIDDLRSHHESQLSKLLKACTEPKTAFELLPILFRRELAGMHFFLALGEAVAHLEYLACDERLAREVSDNVTRYRSVV